MIRSRQNQKNNGWTGKYVFNKRGSSLPDLMFIGCMLFVIAIIFIIGMYVMSSINTSVQSAGFSAGAKTNFNSLTNTFTPLFNSIFLGIVVLGIIAMIVGAFYVRTHPVVFFVLVFLMIFVVIAFSQFSNVYQAVAATPELTTIANNFDGMSYIIQYLPFFMIIITLIVGIILYSKIQIPSGGI